MTAASDDIDAYLTRLGVDREPPSVDALFRLHRAQVERVPYETTWIHMGERWNVDREASLHRVANRKRGGYCFHLNGALSLLLDALGYDVTLHIGGVHGPDGPQETSMRNHLVLTVSGLPTDANPDGGWYVDAGLGDALLDPLPLRAGRHEQAEHTFALAPTTGADTAVGDWHFTHDPKGGFTGMVFRATPAVIDDFAARNVELSTSPESGFVKIVTAQRRHARGGDVMRGLVLKRINDGTLSTQTFDASDEWFDALRELFDLPLDDVPADQRDALWQRVVTTNAAWLAQGGDGPT